MHYKEKHFELKPKHKASFYVTIKKMKKDSIYIVLAVVLGYFAAMLIRVGAPKSGHKVTFFGVIGAFLTTKYPKLSSFFAGTALYDLGHNAGITFVSERTSKPLGKIKDTALAREEIISWEGKTFNCRLSKWFPAYYLGENYNLKTTFYDILTSPYDEIGIYFIKETKSNQIIYIGSTYKQGFKRLYRHFQSDGGKKQGLTHEPYQISYGDEYKIRIVKIDQATPERIASIERYFQQKHKPRDSYRGDELSYQDSDIIDAEFEVLEEAPF